jgi:uncharacterized protein
MWECSIRQPRPDALAGFSIIAGTSFFWASVPEGEVDYLVIDEAGQLSLIDTFVSSLAARNLVLFGDPQQLTQPQQAVHPEGAEASALGHLLQGARTVHAEQGVFLARSWRMHPAICAFVSEMFYDGRLLPVEGLERQRLEGPTRFAGAGLTFEACRHRGNRNRSTEEAERVQAIVSELTASGVTWVDDKGDVHPMTLGDILVLAPYNAQVQLLRENLPEGVAVGTVDKFQGQEAPVVVFSMANSTVEDAPRGMEFLYSPNRFNVAVSRAKIRFVLVADPGVLTPECGTPERMRLANAFCRFGEVVGDV